MSKVKKIVLVFLSFITILTLVLSVPVSAVEPTVYTVQYQKPNVDTNSGYIEILMDIDSTNSLVFVFSYSLIYNSYYYQGTDVNGVDWVNDNVVMPQVRFYKYGTGKIVLEVDMSNATWVDNLSVVYSLFNSATGSSVYDSVASKTSGFDDTLRVVVMDSSYTMASVRSYGNCKLYQGFSDVTSSKRNWTVTYGSDTALYYKMEGMKEALQHSNQIVVDNANQNASQIQQNQDENTDKIIENQQQMQENEKNEAETQGQGSVDEIGSAIEDKSAGFISAIGSLVNSMSYNGTACAWSFPALKLPAIEGVMPEYQLTQEQPIDFEFWVNKIPSDILLLVRSLLTIALIVYCFKELYSTISYVLTLKGGGNSE